MPINATPEYYKAEAKFRSSRSRDEKIAALEEMIRQVPKHKGTENVLAQLRAKLAKLRKESSTKRGGRKTGIAKEGDAQVCILGLTNSGKSRLISKLTNAKPKVDEQPYTTIKPVIGMMDYMGIKIQLIEIPSTFTPENMSVARTANLVVLLFRKHEDRKKIKSIAEDNFIRAKKILADYFKHNPEEIKEMIWKNLGLMITYTVSRKKTSPMALKKGSLVKDFAMRVHKDFIKDFNFAHIKRGKRIINAGLNYKLEDGDIVEIHIK